MSVITFVCAGQMNSAITFPAFENGHEVRLVGSPLDRDIIDGLKKDNFHITLKRTLHDGIKYYQIEELEEALELLCKDYDKLFASKSEEDSKSNVKVKSVQIGDTTTTFVDKTSQVEINGIVYNTGTVNYSEDGLIEKYKKDLYRHRKMRW